MVYVNFLKSPFMIFISLILFQANNCKLQCKVCGHSKMWAIPPSRADGKRTKKWSKLLFHLAAHVAKEKQEQHIPLLRQSMAATRDIATLAEMVSFNLVTLAYKNILSGNSYR